MITGDTRSVNRLQLMKIYTGIAALFFFKNSWRSEEITYYTLIWIEKAPKNARDANLDAIGKSKVKWKREVVCCAHWSSGQRLSLDDLPDVKHTFKDDTLTTSWHWN